MRPQNDWDEDERAALAGLHDQLEAIRQRHALDPPVELLAAAAHDQPPADAPFDDLAAQRVWTAIQQRTRPSRTVPAWSRWASGAAAAIAATIVMAVFVDRDGEQPAPSSTPGPATVPAASQPAPAAVAIEFSKPEVRLSTAALTWRGGDGNPFLRDLKPAIEAYRSSRYADAETLLASLASQYQRSVEVAFFLGVVRMLRDDFSGAIAPLTQALAANEPAFTEDAAWYLAVAEQHSGRQSEALRRIAALCAGSGARAREACDAQKRLASPR